MITSKWVIALALLLLTVGPVWAHGGDEHSHGEPKAPVPAGAQAATVRMATATERFELVLTLDAAETGATRHLHLYLSDFASNAPIIGAQMSIDWGDQLSSTATATRQEGVYEAAVQFPRAGDFAPLVSVSGPAGEDLLTLEPLTVHAPAPSGGGRNVPWALALAGLGLLAVIGVWLKLRRGARKPVSEVPS